VIVYAVLPSENFKKTFVMPDDYELQRIRDFNTGKKNRAIGIRRALNGLMMAGVI